MVSNSQKGQYYKARTKKWLEERGYVVAQLERMHMLRPGKGNAPPLYVKQDQLGADLLAVDANGTLFVQVKMGGAKARLGHEMTKAKQVFEAFPVPPCAEQMIVVWDPGAREPSVFRRARTADGALTPWDDPEWQPGLRLQVGRTT